MTRNPPKCRSCHRKQQGGLPEPSADGVGSGPELPSVPRGAGCHGSPPRSVVIRRGRRGAAADAPRPAVSGGTYERRGRHGAARGARHGACRLLTTAAALISSPDDRHWTRWAEWPIAGGAEPEAADGDRCSGAGALRGVEGDRGAAGRSAREEAVTKRRRCGPRGGAARVHPAPRVIGTTRYCDPELIARSEPGAMPPPLHLYSEHDSVCSNCADTVAICIFIVCYLYFAVHDVSFKVDMYHAVSPVFRCPNLRYSNGMM